MVSSIDISLSGLNASSRQIEVSANNIVNQFSTSQSQNGKPVSKPYTPQHVDQVSLSSGGVQALVSNNSNPTTSVPDSSANGGQGGTTQYPNVDTATELVTQSVAATAYKANLQAIKVANNAMQSLLDIVS